MKKKILLILCMFMFITNVKALTFNVDVTNIESKGNNGTMGAISNIDITNKTLDASFSDIGDEVSFGITITNSGDRAGTLKSIGITSTNNKIEYTTNLPAGGLAINGNDTNKVLITAKLKSGAVNGTSSSTIKITYNYDEGSCPEGEILSDDESMCLCPTGKVRTEKGTCEEPAKPVECKEDEIYNTESKTCEKKVVPVEPEEPNELEPTPETKKEEQKVIIENPKTLDNIILISLLFVVSGLGIYTVIFKKLNTNKKKITAGVITGVITLTLSFTVLASIFGIDKLLSTIINPITKTKELTITVNERIEMVEVWNGNCSTNSYAPTDVFEGGSGTEEDPYQVKTANQLACLAESVNNGNTYEGKYIKQVADIKLNDKLIESMEAGSTSKHVWTSIGINAQYYFAGNYNGDNHTVSGLLLTNDSCGSGYGVGLFGVASGATFKNLVISDVFINVSNKTPGALLHQAKDTLVLDNITTYGKYADDSYVGGGVIGSFSGSGLLKIENTTNNISNVSGGIAEEIVAQTTTTDIPDEPSIILRNVTNNGNVVFRTGENQIGGITVRITSYMWDANWNYITTGNVLLDNVVNTGDIEVSASGVSNVGGLVGAIEVGKLKIENSHNSGDISSSIKHNGIGGLVGSLGANAGGAIIDNSYNSGDITNRYLDSYTDGLTQAEVKEIRLGESAVVTTQFIGGLVGYSVTNNATLRITDSYNTGTIKTFAFFTGGLVATTLQYEGSEYRPGENVIIEDSYNEGDIYAAYGDTAGVIVLSRGTITGCHNSGTITVAGAVNDGILGTDNTINFSYGFFRSTPIAGIVGGASFWTNVYEGAYGGATVTDSYNEGNIIINANIDKIMVAGICGDCQNISNSYNTGNITSKYATESFDGVALRVFGTNTGTSSTGTITTP